MKKEINKYLYWTPRILSIIFILFLALMSLDVLESNYGFRETFFGLLIHNIPVIILLVILIISWKQEIIGGVAFILTGIAYIFLILKKFISTGFEWYYLSWIIQISGIAFLIGILFIINWVKKR